MKFELSFQNDEANLIFFGIISSDAIYTFQEKLDAVKLSEVKTLTLDFSECSSFSSTNIGRLLNFYKEFLNSNRKIIINGCSDSIFRLFEAIKIDKLIEIKR